MLKAAILNCGNFVSINAYLCSRIRKKDATALCAAGRHTMLKSTIAACGAAINKTANIRIIWNRQA